MPSRRRLSPAAAEMALRAVRSSNIIAVTPGRDIIFAVPLSWFSGEAQQMRCAEKA